MGREEGGYVSQGPCGVGCAHQHGWALAKSCMSQWWRGRITHIRASSDWKISISRPNPKGHGKISFNIAIPPCLCVSPASISLTAENVCNLHCWISIDHTHFHIPFPLSLALTVKLWWTKQYLDIWHLAPFVTIGGKKKEKKSLHMCTVEVRDYTFLLWKRVLVKMNICGDNVWWNQTWLTISQAKRISFILYFWWFVLY